MKKHSAALVDYIKRQRKYNDLVTLAEEIDFQGLIEYICTELLLDVECRIFNPSRRKRGEARQHIIDLACNKAQAQTDEAKRRVSKFISICLDIIRDFYSKEIDKKDYILAEKVMDAISEISDENTQKIITAVDNCKQVMLDTINGGSLFSIDKAVELTREGRVEDIGLGIKQLLRHTSLEHPLYPHYGFDYAEGRVVSIPLTQEAKKRYPIRYKLNGTLKIGGQYYNNPDGNPIEYAYNHQLPITMEVFKAVRYIGDVLDPVQDDIRCVKELHADPPEFPPAFACSIKVGERTFFEYVLLRTCEILDDGTIVINNREQSGYFRFEVRINPHNPSKPYFSINVKDADNHEYLHYMMFMKALKEVKELHIYVLEAGKDIIAGYIQNVQIPTGFSSVEEEIDFLERICTIEDYFNINLKPEETINVAEHQIVLMISNLIKNDKVEEKWEKVTFTGILDQHFREAILSMENTPHLFSYVGVRHVELFGASFDFQFMRSFKCAYVDDIEKLKKKVEVLDDGDSINMTFKAGEDKISVETLSIPEGMAR